MIHSRRVLSTVAAKTARETATNRIKDLCGRVMNHKNQTMNAPLLPGRVELSPSVLAGHMSYILLGVSYLETDMFLLRTVAVSGITCSMLFQYYRPLPLFMPLRWNAIFLSINVVMASALYLERREAEGMDTEMEELYMHGKFEERGFSRVHFRRLMSKARKETLAPGHRLTRLGVSCNTLAFLSRGQANVEHKGETLAAGINNSFVGEMSFLHFLTEEKSEERVPSRRRNTLIATADVTVQRGGATVWVWQFDELRECLRSDQQLSNAFLAYVSHDLKEKLVDTSKRQAKSTKRD